MTGEPHNKIKVGISACLLGQSVRFDGAHKNAPLCSQVLSKWFEFVPICPEVESGMGVPREPIQLVNENNQIRVKNVSDHSRDYTSQLHAVASQNATELNQLCGYIFMQKSPSCGLFSVKLHNARGQPQKLHAMGAFAHQVKQQHPLLPVEEAGRIEDIELFENFIVRVFANHDWRQHVLTQPVKNNLLTFHQRYELLLRTHSEVKYQHLSLLVAEANPILNGEQLNQYFSQFTACLMQIAKPSNHLKSLQSILKVLENKLTSEVNHSIAQLIDRYAAKKVPLMVPVSLLNYYVETHKVESLLQQKYLSPYPSELALIEGV